MILLDQTSESKV